MNTLFVIGNPYADPWVLNLDGYQNLTAAKRAIYWQTQFNPTAPWAIAELRDGQLVDVLDGRVYNPTQRPYTDKAWAEFKERLNHA
jgi:hypothetical protein